MYVIHEAKQQVLTELKKAMGKEFRPTMEDLQLTPNPAMGDVSFPCFALAKGMKRNPAEIASEIAAKVGPKGFLKKIEAAGPYVNFTFDDAAFGQALLTQVREQARAYGTATAGEGKRVMIEFANLNTHKDIHVGHLRNVFVGQALVNLQTAVGYEVVPVSYINDMGANVAACLWGVKNSGETQQKEEDALGFLNRMYVFATAAAEASVEKKAEISEIQRDLEELKGPYVKLWKKTRDLSMKALKATFKELKLTIDTYYLESDFIADTKTLVEGLVEKGIVVHSNGAWIVNLEDEKLGVNLLVKSDGTLLYNAKDLALAMRKEEDYHPHRSMYVIDVRQSLVMQQLFATLRRMGFTKDLVHISYDFVTLKEGAMASRKGNVIRYETLRDTARDLARTETKKRHEDWSAKQVEKTAAAITDAALRFAMLKQDPDKKIVFDMQEAVSFEGFTGPYLLYTYARMQSLLKKAGRVKPRVDGTVLKDPTEHRLLLLLSRYPDVVFQAGASYHLSAISQYLFELAQAFGSYYDAVPVLQSEDKKIVAARLGLVDAVRQVLENGCGLLGIETVDEM